MRPQSSVRIGRNNRPRHRPRTGSTIVTGSLRLYTCHHRPMTLRLIVILLLLSGGGGVGVGFGLAIVFDLPWGWLLVAGGAIALIPGFILFVRLRQRDAPQTTPGDHRP